MIVTIDGPAGSGKSTTARAVAERLGYLYLDTGAMYRAVAWAFLRTDTPPTTDGAASLLPQVTVDVWYDSDEMRVSLNGDDVSDRIRTGAVGDMASQVSTLRAVREKMVEEQRRIAREHDAAEGGVVLDGRDTGTVVFPDAPVKIYMTADPRERARRRQSEYGDDVSLDEVHREIERRDRLDRERDIAPLRKADDAIELDTTHSRFEEQVDFVVDCVKQRAEGGT
jgi:cytidylate kinase